MKKVGLILEGGGMRGIYTAGVLDFFIEKKIEVDVVIGVSAGTCHGASYISKQHKRGYNTSIDYIHNKEYLSFRNFLKNGSIFGMDFMFKKIPNELNLYDYDTFNKSKTKFIAVTTNCESGEAEYFHLKDLRKDTIYMQASCSIPVVANIVEVDGYKLLDGGVTDSIPIEYAIKEGCEKTIVVLTRDETYRKNKQRFMPIIKMIYRKYPNLVRAIENRHNNYNNSLSIVSDLSKKNKIFVIRPKNPVNVSQVEKDKSKLNLLYEEGYNDAKEVYHDIINFIK